MISLNKAQINNVIKKGASLFLITLVLTSFVWLREKSSPTLYIIGDSTVNSGPNKSGLFGWGSFLESCFNTKKLRVENKASGGASSRSFLTNGSWAKVLGKLKAGDFLIIQFGHNDSGSLEGNPKAKGTIKGSGSAQIEVYNPTTNAKEIVHTYGWYLSKFITDAQSKGVEVFVCSPIPRNYWRQNKVVRASADYGQWSEEVAKRNGAFFIDLNNLVATKYEALGKEKVSAFFPKDRAHTDLEGAKLNAKAVFEGIKNTPASKLKKFIDN